MRSDYLLVSKNLKPQIEPTGLTAFYESEWFTLYANKPERTHKDSVLALIDGYILPRNSLFREYQNYQQSEIILDLYVKYGDDLTSYIKGLFTLVIIDNGVIKIFTDHLGITKVFYHISHNSFTISNNYKLVAQCTGLSKINGEALAIKSLLNREKGGETLITGINHTLPATKISITENATGITKYWEPESLVKNGQQEVAIDAFASVLQQNIKSSNHFHKSKKTAITLTGGKDSRTALNALLGLGIKPYGITYGNPLSIDAVYAKKLAKAAEIDHLVVEPPKSEEWFEKSAQNIINLNNPLINIHRGHRLFSIQKAQEVLGNNTSLYTGYMGGELLMGVYFDNLIFTNFIKDFWQNGLSEFDSISKRHELNFIRKDAIDISQVKNRLQELKIFDTKQEKAIMQFHSMFEIGILHHSQDIQIAMQYLDFPIPFFLDIEFLELLFSSKYSFLSQNVETKNLLKRHSLFELNLKLQHNFYPKLDSVFYAKKGTYNTTEFLKGPLYWSMVKVARYFLDRRKYPPTFAYDESYRFFLVKNFEEIIQDKSSPINEIYDVPLALESLLQQPLLTTESPLHRYSNIVMHYKQYREFTKEYLG